jgi:hypothetical protein
MSPARNTQLSDYKTFKASSTTYSDVMELPIPGNNQGLTYKKINVNAKYPDGTSGDLIFKTPKCFSFGVSENINDKTGEVDGYSFPICLHSKEGVTPDELAFVECIEAFVENTKQHLIKDEVKEGMGRFDMEYSDLKKLNPIYRKKDAKGKLVEGQGPVLYPRVIMNKKTGAILSAFYKEEEFDEKGEPIELEFKSLISNKMQKNYCLAVAAIKIESIYIGTNISIQVKLWEADIEQFNSKPQKLLRTSRPVVQRPRNVIVETARDMKGVATRDNSSDNESSDEEGMVDKLVASDKDDSDNEASDPTPAPEKAKKKVVRKKVVKKI